MRRPLPLLACVLALAGCGGSGGGDGERGERPGATTPGGGRPSSTPAGARSDGAVLRATTTRLLADHSALTAYMVNAALAEGLDDAVTDAAIAAVDERARGLAQVVRERAGAGTGDAVLAQLRRRSGAFIDYAKAVAAEDADAASAAREDLGDARAALGDVLRADEVTDQLRPVTGDLLDAVDAALEGSGAFYDEVRRAVSRTPGVSRPFATALAEAADPPPDGSPTAPAADLRARFTALLAGHVHLLGAAVAAGAAAGFDSEPYQAAAVALDRNSAAVARAFGEATDPEAETRFLELWRAHVGMFVSYATAQEARDRGAAQVALEELEGWRQSFGAFLAEAVPALPAGAATQQLEPHVTSVTGMIRAAVKRSPATFERLLDASARTEPTAAILADALARALPERFPSN